MTADRCKETTTTTGTGNITLLGAVTQFQAFGTAFLSYPATVSYAIVGQSGAEWEVGVGTLTDATTLERTTVQASSNAGAAVNLSAGTKDVFATVTAADIAGILSAIAGKAATVHTHVISDTTGLQTALDGKADTSHTHVIADTTGLQTALDGKAATSHLHAATDLTSGTLPDAVFPATLPAASGVNLTALNASNLASGTVADARLSSNVPLINAANTFTAANTISVNGAASTPPLYISGTWYTGGSATTTKPQLLVQPSAATSTNWSTAGTGIGVNASSGFTGNLIDAQVNGVRRFYVTNSGDSFWYKSGGGSNDYFYVYTGGSAMPAIGGTSNATGRLWFLYDTGSGTTAKLAFGALGGLTWQSTNRQDSGSVDTGINRNAAGVAEVNNGTTGTFRDIKARNVICDNTLQLKGFTVATLPAGTAGMRAYVTDATAPTYLGALIGGGGVTCPVFYNGAAWVSC